MYNMSSFVTLARFFTSCLQNYSIFLFKNDGNGMRVSHLVLQPQMCLLYHSSANDGDDKRINITY
jgi:hypothetical protein